MGGIVRERSFILLWGVGCGVCWVLKVDSGGFQLYWL